MTDWIDVKERLPENKTNTIATNGKETYLVYYHQIPESKRDDAWYIPYSDLYLEKVTHWMPLPEPPK